MKIPQSYIQKCKVVAHVFQGLLIFIAGCITLSIFTKDGVTGGASKWFFALCFLTIPALIYLVMVPMWSRAQKFANAYAFIAVDALYTLFWFSAFISIALWNSQGIRQGAKDKHIDENSGNCTTFAYGPEDKCKLSRATFGFGVLIWLLFMITTFISSYYLIKFRKDGVLPYISTKSYNPSGGDHSLEANKDNAWSADTHDIDHLHRESDDDDTRTERGGNQEEDEYALLHSTDTDEGRHPGRPLSWGEDRRYSAQAPAPPYAEYEQHQTNALSPGGYEEYRRPGVGLQGQGNYSFSGGDVHR
ncbi:hypothetical protein K432DRAFT_382870 [Lepidopterella palustris CBS 459.81]|uniref:MARVEL domain-containing protein n=1 Tax=Lepidopterella palustris CBS 459.81 TaxID=1314670 RepID=A0A8E2E9C1_9PEZI|nr:hypothetical protein K432DRAFT_382870 [Lepidopterella palustris CBS 459.81]